MSDFVEYIPKRHGQKPDFWTPDTLTGLDGKNYVRQPNWAWIAGTTYYVPYEAVHGVPRPAPVDEALDAGPVEALPADKVAALVEASEGLKRDMLNRAEWDDDTKVVCAGTSAWLRFTTALAALQEIGQ